VRVLVAPHFAIDSQKPKAKHPALRGYVLPQF
jgi:hypothetical protein